jgi:hypothetical protein
MHCTTDEERERVFLHLAQLMEHQDDAGVAAELGSVATLLEFGHLITREDLVGLYAYVRPFLAQAGSALAGRLDSLLAAGFTPRAVVSWCDGPGGRLLLPAPLTLAALVGVLRDAAEHTLWVAQPIRA